MTANAPPLDASDPRVALQRVFDFPDFRPGQEEVVRAVLAGEDVLAVMPTGAGKSLCYQLPAMLLPGCTVVISPLVALMKDQIDSLPAELRTRAAVFNSTIERDELDAATAELAAGQLKLVYVAPERLRQRPFLHALARANISRLVVDEAHCVSLWGHDFRPDYLFIPTVVALLGSPPLLAMTATATHALQEELRQRFDRPLRVVHTGVIRPNLALAVERARNADEKLRRLVELCTETRGPGIVYVSSRKNAEEVAGVLRRQGVSARHYHAGLEPAARAATQDAFMRGQVRVIVATVAFGMGVDKPDVRFIVHFNPSRSLEAYAQESGRAGRDGHPARCILLWTSSDKTALARWARDDALSRDLLQAVYRAVRQGARNRFAWWPLDHLVRAVQQALGSEEAGDTDVRVALGALEQVGVLRRHCDLPELARIVAGPLPPPPVAAAPSDAGRGAVGSRLGLPTTVQTPPSPRRGGVGGGGEVAVALDAVPGERLTVPMLEVADALGCPPSEVEERLLVEQDAGVLAYQGLGRGLLVELLPHPPELAERLRRLLEDHQRAQAARGDEMMAYAISWSCRAAMIAAHFGVPHPATCGNCDVCVAGNEQRATLRLRSGQAGNGEDGGQTSAPSLPERAPEDIIVECIAELPFPMGRTGVSRVLKGVMNSRVQADRSRHFGALAALTTGAIEREIEALVEAGYLHRDDGEYRLLSVTAAGFAKPPAPWPPPVVHLPRPPTRGRERARDAGARPAGSRRVPLIAPPLPAFAEDDPRVGERFERLRDWRGRTARAVGLPAYTVFHDETLGLLAATHVRSREDLTRIKGVGPAKLEKYGDEVLALLREDDE